MTTANPHASAVKAAWQADADIAQRYKTAENATRPFAKIMIDMSDALAPIVRPASSADVGAKKTSIFDLGCGTGAVEAELYARLSTAEERDNVRVLAGDVSPAMLEYLSQRAKEEGWNGVETRVVDGGKLEEAQLGEEAGFDGVFVGFAIFMLPPDAVGKLVKVMAGGATLAVSSWADLPWFPVLKETYARMEDGPEQPTEQAIWSVLSNGLPWYERGFVRETLEKAGLGRVQVRQERVRVECGNVDVVMKSMGFVLGVVAKLWPEEKREGWLAEVKEKMRALIVEQAGGERETVFWEFEGIVGVGVKEE